MFGPKFSRFYTHKKHTCKKIVLFVRDKFMLQISKKHCQSPKPSMFGKIWFPMMSHYRCHNERESKLFGEMANINFVSDTPSIDLATFDRVLNQLFLLSLFQTLWVVSNYRPHVSQVFPSIQQKTNFRLQLRTFQV